MKERKVGGPSQILQTPEPPNWSFWATKENAGVCALPWQGDQGRCGLSEIEHD